MMENVFLGTFSPNGVEIRPGNGKSLKDCSGGSRKRKGSGSVMGAIGSDTVFSRNLPQLKNIYHSLFRRVGRSLPAAAVFVGMLVPAFLVFSADRAESSVEKATDRPISAVSAADELCRWKRDVAFFSALRDGRKAEQEGVPCEVPEQGPEKSESDRDAAASGNNDLASAIRELTAGHPIEAMAGTIAGYDKEVAALIVGIAKKESNWGKHVPLDAEGKDCFNYWGWKGAGARGTAMGHGCFGSREEAVKAVGDRLVKLVELRQTSEPKNLTVWKCGSSCATHSPESVRKWVSDVDMYYRKIAKN